MLSPVADESILFQTHILNSGPLSEPDIPNTHVMPAIPAPHEFNLTSGIQIPLKNFTLSSHPPPCTLLLSDTKYDSRNMVLPKHELILKSVPRALRTRSQKNNRCSPECIELDAHINCLIKSDSAVVLSFCVPEPDEDNFSLYNLDHQVFVLKVSRVHIRLELESEYHEQQLENVVRAITGTGFSPSPAKQRGGLQTPSASRKRSSSCREPFPFAYTPTRQSGYLRDGSPLNDRKLFGMQGANFNTAKFRSNLSATPPPKLRFKSASPGHLSEQDARQESEASPSPFCRDFKHPNDFIKASQPVEASVRREAGLYGPLFLVPLTKISISRNANVMSDTRASLSLGAEKSEDIAEICTGNGQNRNSEMVWTHISGSQNLLLMLAPRPDGLLLQLKFNTKTLLFILAPQEIYDCYGGADRIRVHHAEGIFQVKATSENTQEIYRVMSEYGIHPKFFTGTSALPSTQMPSSAYGGF